MESGRHSFKSGYRTAKSKDGFKLCYEKNISDLETPVLFFLHGLGGDFGAWRFVRNILAKKGFSSVAMDLRGHGYSDHPRTFSSYKMYNLVEDIVSLMEKEGIKKVILIGHCYGAIVALNFAIKYPEKLEKLIIISGSYRPPFYIFGKITKILASGILNFVSFFSLKPYKPCHSKYPAGKFHKDYEWMGLMKTIIHNSPRSYMLASKEIINLNLKSLLDKIKTATLVIVGEKDSIFPVIISKKIHERIPVSMFKVILGANHVVILNNPDQVADLICDFLKDS